VRRIVRWWREQPAANIGLVTGQASGVLVLDVDPGHGGEEALTTLAQRYGELPASRRVRTGGGGFHAYFRLPSDGYYASCVGLDGLKGIDVRGDGGYVVTPPSCHATGTRYRWEDERVPIAPAPAWLLDLSRRPARDAPRQTDPPEQRPAAQTTTAAARWLNRYVRQATVGTRNQCAYLLAQQLRDSARLSLEEAQPIILQYQQAVDDPDTPFTPEEALATLRSIYAQPPRDPAQRVPGRKQDPPDPKLGEHSKPEKGAPEDATGSSELSHVLAAGAYDAQVADNLVAVAARADDLWTPNYTEDRAVRRAVLGRRWPEVDGVLQCTPCKGMTVYVPPAVMTLEEARVRLLEMGGSTVLTLRIAMTWWNLLRHTGQLGANGAALLPLGVILKWRGRKQDLPGSPGHRRKDGWRKQDLEEIMADFARAILIHVRGKHFTWKDGYRFTHVVNGPYVHITEITDVDTHGRLCFAGVWFAPGSWMNSFLDAANYQLTRVERQIFELNPHNEKYELYLALFLTELWRMQANARAYGEPIMMRNLLYESVIAWDRKRLTNRLVPAIEHALETLHRQGIIGEYACLTPVDRSKAQWGTDWLESRWRILPPSDVQAALNRETGVEGAFAEAEAA
jgi:hypothetical protein